MPIKRYEGSGGKWQLGADALSLARVPASKYFANRLSNDMKEPGDRTWGFATQIAGLLATDKVDGILARRAQSIRGNGKDPLGGWIDQLSDKAVFNILAGQLARNEDIDQAHITINNIRDVPVQLGRVTMQAFGGDASAGNLGKIKAGLQVVGLVVACSPLQNNYPNLANNLLYASDAVSVASGIGYLAQTFDFMQSVLSGSQPDEEVVANFVSCSEEFVASKNQFVTTG